MMTDKGFQYKSVLHVITRLIHGGADENTLISCIELKARGWDVTLIIGKEHTHDLEFIKSMGINIIIVDSLKRPVSLFNDVKAIFEIVGCIKNIKPNIVHTHTAKAGVVGRVAARICNVPIVIHGIHGSPFDSLPNNWKRRLFKVVEKLTSSFNDYYISVGEDIFKKYCKQVGIRNPQYTIARSAFNVDAFSKNHEKYRKLIRTKYGFTENDIVVGMIARVAPQKGYEYYLQLCEKLTVHDNKFKFISVGRVDDDLYYRSLVNNKNRSYNNICFVGQINSNVVPYYISAIDIIVHTALWEGLPRVVVEALVANKPVFAFNVEGINEVIKHNVNGFIVELGDINTMSAHIIELVDDIGFHSFRKKALKVNNDLKEDFRKEKMIDKIESVYFQMIQKYD